MRLEVTIPDPIYNGAQRAAAASGLTMESFVVDAIRLHLNETPSQPEPLRLPKEQVARVRAAQEDVKAGRVYTSEELRANLDADREAWLAANPH